MSDTTLSFDDTGSSGTRRVVEFELKRPRREDIHLPKADVEPVRQALEQVALTSIGLAILTARSVVRTLEEARAAGQEAAEHPGPVTRTVMGLLGHKSTETQPLGRRTVPMVPITDYDSLESDQIIARLTGLSAKQLDAVRAYELEHERRTAILKAIDGLSATAT